MRLSFGRLFVITALTLPVAGVVPAAAGRPFSLTISTIQASVAAGSDVKLMIKLTNVTNHEILITDMDQVCDFTVEVHDSNGRSAPETEQKRKHNCDAAPVAGRFISRKLKPGEHAEYLIFPNDLYDMTRPDKYTVQVTREIPKEFGKGQVSNRTSSQLRCQISVTSSAR